MDDGDDNEGINFMMWMVVILCTVSIFAMHLDKDARWGVDTVAISDDVGPSPDTVQGKKTN